MLSFYKLLEKNEFKCFECQNITLKYKNTITNQIGLVCKECSIIYVSTGDIYIDITNLNIENYNIIAILNKKIAIGSYFTNNFLTIYKDDPLNIITTSNLFKTIENLIKNNIFL